MLILQNIKVAGSFFSLTQEDMSTLEIGSFVQVTAEPTNKYDRNALSLWYNDLKVGYIPKTHSEVLASMLRQGDILRGKIVALEPEAIQLYIDLYKIQTNTSV